MGLKPPKPQTLKPLHNLNNKLDIQKLDNPRQKTPKTTKKQKKGGYLGDSLIKSLDLTDYLILLSIIDN